MLSKMHLPSVAPAQPRAVPTGMLARPLAARAQPCSRSGALSAASPAKPLASFVLLPPAVACRTGTRVVCQAVGGDREYKVEVERVSAAKRRARVTVPAKLVKQLFKKAVDKLQREVIGTMPGFRDGKLPLAMIMQQVGGQTKFNGFCVEEILLNAEASLATVLGNDPMIPGSLRILSAGKDLMARYDPGRELSFDIAYEAVPPLKWTTPVMEISVTIQDTGDYSTDAAAADDLIRQYRKQKGFSRVVAGRGLQMGDTAIIDMEVRSKATDLVLPGLEQKRFSFDTEIDPLGLAQGLVGAKPGETRSFNFTFPEDYNVELWQNTEAKAVIKVHEIFYWQLPEFNDEYVAQHHPQFKSAAEMRESLIAATAVRRVEDLDKQLEDAVIKAVASAVEVEEVPEAMVEALGERQFQSMLLAMIQDKVASQEQVEKLATEEVAREFIEKRRADLVEQIKFNLAVDDVFASQGLALDEQAVQAEADLRKQQLEAMQQPYDRDELMDDVRETVRNVTVVEWLKDNLKRTVLPWSGDASTAAAGGEQQQAADSKQQPVAA